MIVYYGDYVVIRNLRGKQLWQGWLEGVEESPTARWDSIPQFDMRLCDDHGIIHHYIIYVDHDIIEVHVDVPIDF